MPCNYKDYSPHWKTVIRPAILARAGAGNPENACCESCGVPNYAIGYRDQEGNFIELENNLANDTWIEENRIKVIKIVLTIAHLNHCTIDNRLENLIALCQRCHNGLDIEHRKASRKRNKGIQQLF